MIEMILSIYAILSVAVIVWFFVVRPMQIDKEYKEELRRIYDARAKSKR